MPPPLPARGALPCRTPSFPSPAEPLSLREGRAGSGWPRRAPSQARGRASSCSTAPGRRCRKASPERATSPCRPTSPTSRAWRPHSPRHPPARPEIDILVNSAGTAIRRPAVEVSLADWEKVVAVNMTGTFLASRIAARGMIARGGRRHRQRVLDHGFLGRRALPEHLLPDDQGRHRQHDPGAGRRVGAARHPRQRRGADLCPHALHRAAARRSRTHAPHRGDDAAAAHRRAGGRRRRHPVPRLARAREW